MGGDVLGCCNYQIQTYMFFGQRSGYSPELYIQRLTDFRTLDKRLTFIKARYELLTSNDDTQFWGSNPLFVRPHLLGGGDYMLNWFFVQNCFFCSVNFDRSKYLSYRVVSGITKKPSSMKCKNQLYQNFVFLKKELMFKMFAKSLHWFCAHFRSFLTVFAQ